MQATGWAGGLKPPPLGALACGVPPQIVLRYIQVGGAEKIHKRIFVHWANLFLFICFGPTKESPPKLKTLFLLVRRRLPPVAPARSSRARRAVS
jgi:hypothetical protein